MEENDEQTGKDEKDKKAKAMVEGWSIRRPGLLVSSRAVRTGEPKGLVLNFLSRGSKDEISRMNLLKVLCTGGLLLHKCPAVS